MMPWQKHVKDMFNFLLDPMPDKYEGKKKDYPVNTDFRNGLRFFKILEDPDLSEDTKTEFMMLCIFGDNLQVYQEDIEGLFEFIPYYISGGKQDDDSVSGKKVFDFCADSGRLYSAFRQVYRINLLTEKMHWWEFLQLFHDIVTETRLTQVIDIRGKKVPKDATPEYKAQLRIAKSYYELDKENAAKNQAMAIANLMG